MLQVFPEFSFYEFNAPACFRSEARPPRRRPAVPLLLDRPPFRPPHAPATLLTCDCCRGDRAHRSAPAGQDGIALAGATHHPATDRSTARPRGQLAILVAFHG